MTTRLRLRARRAPVPPALALVGLALALALGCGRGGSAPAPAVDGEVVRSFLALGDTGVRFFLPELLSRQIAVGQGLEAEDRRAPVDALVLLGDNFYEQGLRDHTLVSQLRDNLVRPYCRFLALEGPRSAEVESACPVPRAERRPVPLRAVLGNHDHKSPESPTLESEAVPRFVSNWRLPPGLVETFALGEGIDVVLVDSERIVDGEDPEPVRAALASSRGPFRILAAHHPMALANGQDRDPGSDEMRYRQSMQRAIAASGVPVQLVLSGHVHNLQVLEMTAPAPPLHVVAGGGARPRPVRFESAERRFARETTGFARIDLVRRGGEDRLVASLYATGSRPPLARGAPTLIARWSVDVNGAVRDEGAAR